MNELDAWAALKWLWGALMSALAVLGLRQVARIDALEAGRVEKSAHDREVEHIRAEHQRSSDELKTSLRDHRHETQQSFNRVFQRLDDIADRVHARGQIE